MSLADYSIFNESGVEPVSKPVIPENGVVPRYFRKKDYTLEMVGTMPSKAYCGMFTGDYIACQLADYDKGYKEIKQEHTCKMVKRSCNGATCEICGISHDWDHPGVVEKKAIEQANMLDSTFDLYKAKNVDLRYYNRKKHQYEKYVELIISPPIREYSRYDTKIGLNHMNRTVKGYGEIIGLVGGDRFAVHAVRDGDGKKNKTMEAYRRGELEIGESGVEIGYHNHSVGFVPKVRLKSDDFNLLTSQGIQAIYGSKLLVEVAGMKRKDQKKRMDEIKALHPSLCVKGCENRKTGWMYKLVPQSDWAWDKRQLKKKLAYEMDHSFVAAYDIISPRKRRNQIVYEGQEPDYIETEIHQHGHLFDPVGICHQTNLKRDIESDGYVKCKCKECTTEAVYHHYHDLIQAFDKPGIRGDPVEKHLTVYALKPGRFDIMVKRHALTVS